MSTWILLILGLTGHAVVTSSVPGFVMERDCKNAGEWEVMD